MRGAVLFSVPSAACAGARNLDRGLSLHDSGADQAPERLPRGRGTRLFRIWALTGLLGLLPFATAPAAEKLPVPAASQGADKGIRQDRVEAWLQQISAAARSMNYSGVFVTQRGGEMSASSLVHYVVPQGNFERIETLDGQRRTMVCLDDEVHTSWPDYRLMLIDNQPGHGSFPGLLKISGGEVDRNYRLEHGGDERCAGHQCQVSTIIPRDDLRWGYRLWALRDSHLLVKAQTLDAAGHVIDQVAFAQLKINVPPDPELVRRSLRRPPGYAVEKMRAVPVTLQSQGWTLSAPVPGFKTVGVYRRSMTVGSKSSEVLQWLLSDGLASMSIFIQPAGGLPEPVPAEQRVGGTLAVSRPIGDSWITVMGAVPERTLHRLSDAVARTH